MATRIDLLELYDDKWERINPVYEYYPWLLENVYSGGRQQWKLIHTSDNFIEAIIFYNDEDALAFKLRFGL